ncbi:MAG: hypothetical protein UT88_C0014G0008 [Candidatus Woesebacteria bacterium GW2011_GWD2_40_19]|nr:MAG: hypothetical protein UT88_C0014G0008 [Candidatus Woesebacteria bacterium GW2011_GWD2_40_19]
MKILGIDYGRSKIGVAIADGPLAEPMQVIRYSNTKILMEKLHIEKIVVGVSEGKIGEESKKFASSIQPLIQSTIILADETLSTQDAQRMSREAGISQKKRHEMEDAYAACIMLQNYLDN